VFAVRDLKSQEYLGLILLKNAEEAQRLFLACLADDPRIKRFPKDYAIHDLGGFDTEVGVLEGSPVRDVTPYTEVDAWVAQIGKTIAPPGST